MTTASPRSIQYMPVSTVARADLNPKDHDLDVVQRSIRRFGFVDGAIHDGRTGKLIAGHGRLEGLQAMLAGGESAPDGIVPVTDGDTVTDWLMPVQVGWSSRSDVEAAALLVVLNKATELGGWVEPELAALMSQLRQHEDGDALLRLTGFSSTETDRLLASLKETEPTFEPTDDGTRLDQREPTTCPSCGHSWRVGPGGKVEPC